MVADNETRKEARAIYRILTKTYPEIRCELDFKNPLELIVAVVLSAQCTDKRVNTITPALFKKYKKAKDYAKAPLAEIEEFIFSAGFYHAKARHLKGLGTKLVEEFDGKVPGNLDDLITLPGVGRKTANVVLGHAFDIPGITVDTHFGRLSRSVRGLGKNRQRQRKIGHVPQYRDRKNHGARKGHCVDVWQIRP